MRALAFIFILMTASLAHAQYSSANFTFQVQKGDTPGCIRIDYYNNYGSFPNLDIGVVTSVRFFYSRVDANDVTEASDYQESFVETDDGNVTLSPNVFCGFRGGRTYFKYGLYDTQNHLLEFMKPEDWNDYSNSVEIEDP